MFLYALTFAGVTVYIAPLDSLPPEKAVQTLFEGPCK